MENETEEEGIELAPGVIAMLYAAFGIRRCWQNKIGRFHRLDGPAIIYYDGDQSWLRNGYYHRDDGPAHEWATIEKEAWFKYGEEYEPTAHELMVWKMKKKED